MLDATRLDDPLVSFRIDIGSALKKLVESEDMRRYDILVLSMYVRGMPISDMSVVLGRSKNAVMGRLSTMFNKIAEQLGEDYLE